MPNIRDTGAALDLDTCGMVLNLPKWAEYIEAYPGRIREYNDSLTIESDWRKKFEESWFEQGYRIPVLDRIPKEDAIRFNPSIPFLDSSFLPSLNSFMRLLSSSSSFGLSQTLFDDVVAYEQVVLAFETELLKYRRYRNYVAESKSLTDSFKLALWDRMEDRALEILAHPLFNTESPNSVTILHQAASLNCSRLLEPIMEKLCLSIDSRDDSKTPLFCAVEGSAVDALLTLIKLGANVNLPNCFGDTPLGYAVMFNSADDMYETAEILLDHGADINAVNYSGDTPLLTALKAQRYPCTASMLKLLLTRGASTEHRDKHGTLPIDVVPQQWRDEVKAMFEAVVANGGRLPEDYPVSSSLFEPSKIDIIYHLEDHESSGLTRLFDDV